MTKKERLVLDRYYSKYGITYADYEAKLLLQNNRCALCGKHKKNFTRRMHQDHNHASGRNRGIVCYFCNRRRIGRLTLEWARKIVQYLEKYEDTLSQP